MTCLPNNFSSRVWDSRKLQTCINPGGLPHELTHDAVENFVESKEGEGTVRAEFTHGKSASSAYWDPRGRSIVSTSYDDTLRCGSYLLGYMDANSFAVWELDAAKYSSSTDFPSFTPFRRINHNCQTVSSRLATSSLHLC